MAKNYTSEEVILKVNTAINNFNSGIEALKIENSKKTLEQEEPVIRDNTKKFKTTKQDNKQYDTDSYETYIKDILDSLKTSGEEQSQWTTLIENTCNTANNLLIVIKDKKYQLANSKNSEDSERINKELQEELKSLKRLKAMIEKQKILQELEKKQLNNAHQKVAPAKLNDLVMMARILTLPAHAAVQHFANKEQDEQELLLHQIETDNKTKKQEEIQVNGEIGVKMQETTSKDPVFLPNKDEIGIKSSNLSVINTDVSEISSAKYDPTTLFDKKEKENRSKSSTALSPILTVDNNSINSGPSEENKIKNIHFLPAHKMIVVEKNTSKSKKNKKQKKAKLKQNDEEVLSAVIDGKQFIVYKKVKGSQGYEVIRHGDIIKEQLSNGTYILSPVSKNISRVMFKDDFEDNYFTLKIKKGQKIKLGENFKEKVTEYKSAAYKSQQTTKGHGIAYARSPVELGNKRDYSRGGYRRG